MSFTVSDMVKMVSKDSGSNNIQAIIDGFDSLTKAGFTVNDMVKVVSKHGGSKNIKALLDHHDALNHLGISRSEIVKAASSHNKHALSTLYKASNNQLPRVQQPHAKAGPNQWGLKMA